MASVRRGSRGAGSAVVIGPAIGRELAVAIVREGAEQMLRVTPDELAD